MSNHPIRGHPTMDTVNDLRPKQWYWTDTLLYEYSMPAIGCTGYAMYGALARHADRDREAFPSLRVLQEKLGISRVTLLKYRKILEGSGLMQRAKRLSRQGDHESNLSHLLSIPIHDIDDINPGGGTASEPPGLTAVLPHHSHLLHTREDT